MKRTPMKPCIAVLLAGLISAAGCRARKPVRSIRIGVQNNAFPALVLAAKGEGLFESEGLDVTIVPYPSGKLAMNAALAGEVDLATVADMPIMANSFKRDDFRVLCSIGHTDNGAWIVGRRDRGINGPDDLVGKTIGTQQGSAVHFFLASFLVHRRIPSDQVKIVFMPAIELPGALSDGTIDAFSMRNPFINQAKEALGDKAIEIFEPHAYRQFFTLTIRKAVLDEDATIAIDALTALVNAEAFARDHPKQAMRTVAQQLGPNREDEVAADWNKYIFEVALGQELIRCLEDEARWAIEQGRTPTQELPSFRDVIDSTAIKTVQPEAYSVME